MNQRSIHKAFKKAALEGYTFSEIQKMFPQSDEELTATLKRLYSQTKIIRTNVKRNGEQIIIDIKVLYRFCVAHRGEFTNAGS